MFARVPCYAPYQSTIHHITWETPGRGRDGTTAALAPADEPGWSGEVIHVDCACKRLNHSGDAADGAWEGSLTRLACSLHACPAMSPTRAACLAPRGKHQAGASAVTKKMRLLNSSADAEGLVACALPLHTEPCAPRCCLSCVGRPAAGLQLRTPAMFLQRLQFWEHKALCEETGYIL